MGTTSKMGIPYPASTDYVTDGATDMQAIADQVDAKTGLILISSTTLSGTSQTFTDVFSANYENYRIVISNFQNPTSNAGMTMQLRTSGGPAATNYNLGGTLTTFAGSNTVSNQSAATSWSIISSANTTQFAGAIFDLMCPNLAKWTTIMVISTAPDAGRFVAGNHQTSTAYPSFTLASTGGMTGRISIYGYNE